MAIGKVTSINSDQEPKNKVIAVTDNKVRNCHEKRKPSKILTMAQNSPILAVKWLVLNTIQERKHTHA